MISDDDVGKWPNVFIASSISWHESSCVVAPLTVGRFWVDVYLHVSLVRRWKRGEVKTVADLGALYIVVDTRAPNGDPTKSVQSF